MFAQSNIEDRIFAQEFQDEFWPAWPVKKAKLEAEKAYIRARRGDKFGRIPSRSKASIMKALSQFRVEVSRTDPKFIPRAATWLNQGRDMDLLHDAPTTIQPIISPAWNGHQPLIERIMRKPLGELWPLGESEPEFEGDTLTCVTAANPFKANEIRRKFGMTLATAFPAVRIKP